MKGAPRASFNQIACICENENREAKNASKCSRTVHKGNSSYPKMKVLDEAKSVLLL